jgi:hypothetical protein
MSLRSSIRAPIAAVIFVLGTPLAWAQEGFHFVPAGSVIESYDDNVFSSSEAPETDFVTCFLPGVRGSYRSGSVSVLGHYALEAEYYRMHPSVSTVPSGHDVAAELILQPSPRLRLSTRGGYTETRSPSGLVKVMGLDLGRASARRLAAGGSLARQPTRPGRATFTGDWDRDQIVDAEWGGTLTGTAAFAQRLSPRSEASISYTLRRFEFQTQPGLTAHVVALSWTRGLARTSQVTLSGGPRFESDGTKAEGAAWLQARPGRMDITFGASRAGTRVLGFPGKWLPGAATTDSLQLELGVSPSRRLRFAVTPGLYHTRLDREDRQVTVRRLAVEGSWRMRRWFALETGYEWSLQQGDLSAEPGDVRHGMFSVRFVMNPSEIGGQPLVKKPERGGPGGVDPGVNVEGSEP